MAARIPSTTRTTAVRLVSCGREFPDHKIAHLLGGRRSERAPLPDGTVGEMRLAGPSVMRGYWEDAERRARRSPALPEDGRPRLPRQAAHVFICGRSKEVVIVNGRNYYPQDMEWEAAK
jgi:fatty-acyl-CoA synthase